MYESRLNREEWLFRVLAITTILGLIGMGVVTASGVDVTKLTAIYASQGGNPYLSAGGLIISVGLLKATDLALLLELAGLSIATPLTIGLIGASLAVAA